uniref:Uncharacterized protein n=1 Tax=Romanomermis culicivorax TaxID=13658 RepID=A0A915HR44_ROMCU
MEMNRKAEEKKRKDTMMPTKPAVPPKYQMKPAPIIDLATTTTMQPPVVGIRTSLGAAQRALAPRAPTTSHRLQMPPPSILKASKTLTKVLPKGRRIIVWACLFQKSSGQQVFFQMTLDAQKDVRANNKQPAYT